MIDFELDILRAIGSTNTQSRRLSYLVQICRLLENNYAPNKLLQERIEDWANENNYHLKNYINDKGTISSTARSYGAKRYIKLAHDLQLITSVSGYLRPTIIGLLLLRLDEGNEVSINPFELSERPSLLLFYQLLLNDADYLLEVLYQTRFLHYPNELMEIFQDAVLQRLILIETMIKSPYSRRNAHERYQSISRWQNPIKYSEHIVLPRIHWLLDLKLMDWNTLYALKKFEPNWASSYIMSQLPKINDHLFINRLWCQNDLFKVWSNGFDLESKSWDLLPKEEQKATIEEFVSYGFDKFSPKTHYRVSAYQLILYMIITLLIERKISIDFDSAKKGLDMFSRSGNIHWDFFWSAADNDGYILLRKKK